MVKSNNSKSVGDYSKDSPEQFSVKAKQAKLNNWDKDLQNPAPKK